jgi:mRNA interferase RelE/StbE
VADYAVRFRASARKEMESLGVTLTARIFSKIEVLSANPRPAGCKKLKDSGGLWRIRIGDYRVVYVIDDAHKAVEILRIRHRSEVYEA